jgi:hypothetical protein
MIWTSKHNFLCGLILNQEQERVKLLKKALLSREILCVDINFSEALGTCNFQDE